MIVESTLAITRTEYTVKIGDAEPEVFTDLEQAIRVWDSESYSKATVNGYIGVQQWAGDLMVRDGFLIHVQEGFVYISPTLKV